MIKYFYNLITKKDLNNLIFLFLAMFIAAAIEMIGLSAIPVFIMIIVDSKNLINIFSSSFISDYIQNLEKSKQVIVGASFLIIIFFLKNIYLSIYFYFQTKVTRVLRENISSKLFIKYINAEYKFHINNNLSVLTRNLINSVNAAVSVIISSLTIAKESLILLVIFLLLLLNEPMVSISIFLFLLIVSFFFIFFTKKILTYRGKNFEFLREKQLKIINHSFGSIRETKILNKENYLINIFNKNLSKLEDQLFYLTFLGQTPKLFLEFIAVFSLASLTIIFIILNLTTEQILPLISLIAVCCIRLIPAFNQILSSLSARRFSIQSVKIISNEFKIVPDKLIIKEINISLKKNIFSNKIEFKNVYFSHENSSKIILENISFTINLGEKIGIIGKSGAGKSTLVDLILGLIKPIQGKILIDNVDINENLQLWQKLIGYVPQDIYLLDDTIKNNIALGVNPEEINNELLLNSIKSSSLETYINSLPQRENTNIGNRGIKVSGGQKQRIGFARALYHNPRVIILDEATSSLDSSTEKKVMDDIHKVSEDKTMIIITHKHNSIYNCDKILLLHDGKIIDQGTYSEIKKRQLFL
jgi:ABC-type multidrug transport system fused ATPase/permease subunit